ncbi:MAG: hypothetical protein LBV04_01745 [Deferribacteraceae bacterium]|nr:hypothetical protein [Deferribacteraceae bacterium]
MRRTLIVIIILAFSMLANAQQIEIEQARGTEVSGFPYTNIGKVFDDYFMKPQWQLIIDSEGNKIVKFKGLIRESPYLIYRQSDAFSSLPDSQMPMLVRSLYNIAYDFGLRSDRLYGTDRQKATQILVYLDGRAYKIDSTIEVYFQQIAANTWWVKEFSCETCPPQDANELIALAFDGRFAGSLEPVKNYEPKAASTAVTLPAQVPVDKRIAANTIKTAQFASLEGSVAYFDIGRGAQGFSVPARLLDKAQTLKAGGLVNITFDTVERTANGATTTIYILNDIR